MILCCCHPTTLIQSLILNMYHSTAALRQDSPLLVSLCGSVDASVVDPGTKTLCNQRKGEVSQLFWFLSLSFYARKDAREVKTGGSDLH